MLQKVSRCVLNLLGGLLCYDDDHRKPVSVQRKQHRFDDLHSASMR